MEPVEQAVTSGPLSRAVAPYLPLPVLSALWCACSAGSLTRATCYVSHDRLTKMGRESTIVRMSSKGQIVIPAAVRRRLGLKTGQQMAIRANTQDEIVLRPADRDSDAVDEMLRRLRAAARKLGGDPLRELLERRQRARARGSKA